MTIPGVDATVALSIVAAVGDFRRFRRPEQLVSYLGLNPRVQAVRRPARQPRADHQAGPRARPRDARRGRLGAAKIPGPLRAFYERVRAPPRDADRDRRDRPQARVPVLDDDRARRGLRVRAAVADRQEAPRARAARRDAVAPRAQRATPPRTRSKKSAGASSSSPSKASTPIASSSPTGKPKAPRRPKAGRGRRQRDATEKALSGASCAAGISPRTCASLGGRPRPRAKPNAS